MQLGVQFHAHRLWLQQTYKCHNACCAQLRTTAVPDYNQLHCCMHACTPKTPISPARTRTPPCAQAVVELCSRPDFDASMVGHALTLLEDEEPRVRAAVGEVLGALAAKMGPPVWIQAKPSIMCSIRDNYVGGASAMAHYLLAPTWRSTPDPACGTQPTLLTTLQAFLCKICTPPMCPSLHATAPC